MNASPADVVKALAHRFRTAVAGAWDDDRCQVESASFFAELRHRGWERNPDADWRNIPPVPRPLSDEAHAALVDARRALRAATRNTTTPPPSSSDPEEQTQ